MHTTTLAGAVLALCVPALAQGFITTPRGGLTREGPHSAAMFGVYDIARYQQADAMHTGSKAYTLTQIAFRLDNRDHTSVTATGRTWTNITLDVSETTNYDNMSQVWTQNITATPTRAFDGRSSWPTQVGFPRFKPAAWGGAQGMLRFPFSKPWVYSGNNAILMDYVFRGGVLANGVWWWRSGNIMFYYLDGEFIGTHRKTGRIERLPGLIPCADSAMTSPLASTYTWGAAYAYGPRSPEISLRGKLGLEHYSYYTAPNDAPVVHAIGLGGSTAGVAIGARCHRLYVGFQKPVVLVPLRTMKDASGYSGLMGWAIPWDQAFDNMTLYVQAAWADSKTGAFSLAAAFRVTLPNGLPPPSPPRYKTAYAASATSPRSGPAFTSGLYFPYTQYKVK